MNHGFDLVVIEATPAGVAMAVRAAHEGLRVLLTARGRHLGGMLSSGLGVWDTRWEGARAPVYDEVRARILAYYRDHYGAESSQYACAQPSASGHGNGRFEPHVAEAVIERLVEEAGLTIWRECVAARCERDGRRLTSVTFTIEGQPEDRPVEAHLFADCSYEGDLAALAGAPFRVGREAAEEFSEPHAGRIFLRPAVARDGGRRPWLRLRSFPGAQDVVPVDGAGRADREVQAFNYRTILTSDPANRVRPQPPGLSAPVNFRELDYHSLIEPLPNRKVSWNRPQLPGRATDFVLGDPAERRRVADEHWATTLGLLHHLQNDPTVPPAERARWSELGLAADEFVDHGHRPYELYVREGRRIDGRARMTEHDVSLAYGYERAPVQPDAVGATEWYVDVHACGTERAGDSFAEGRMMLAEETVPGQVPYGALLPAGLDNVIVPVGLSATHIAYSAIRVEPTWMALGEAAAWAAVLARRADVTLPEVRVDELQRRLASAGVMLTFFNDVAPVRSGDQAAAAAQFFGAKGFFPTYDARLGQPLTQDVARCWRVGWERLQTGRLDAPALARAVAASEREANAPVMPMTRGEALVRLWDEAAWEWPAPASDISQMVESRDAVVGQGVS